MVLTFKICHKDHTFVFKCLNDSKQEKSKNRLPIFFVLQSNINFLRSDEGSLVWKLTFLNAQKSESKK